MSQDNEVSRLLDLSKKASIPMEILDLPPVVWLNFDFCEKEIKLQFRKKSLLVHPDKCKHPQAQTAFEILKTAEKILMDSNERVVFVEMMRHARIMVDQDLKSNRMKMDEEDEKYIMLIKFGVRKNFGQVKARIELRNRNEADMEFAETTALENEKKRKLEHDQSWKKVFLNELDLI